MRGTPHSPYALCRITHSEYAICTFQHIELAVGGSTRSKHTAFRVDRERGRAREREGERNGALIASLEEKRGFDLDLATRKNTDIQLKLKFVIFNPILLYDSMAHYI